MNWRIVSALLLLSGTAPGWAQPAVQWQRSLGGSGPDRVRSVMLRTGDGLLVCGTSGSGTNDVKRAEPFGLDDFWVVALAADGTVSWDRTFGGTSGEELASVAPLAEGGFLLGGVSSSTNSGSKTSAGFGGPDYWVTRIDALGNPLWDRSFGGTDIDRLAHIEPLADGGFLLSGYSDSDIGGNKTGPSRGGADGWVLRLNAASEIVWQTVWGGVGSDTIDCAWQLPDGGFLLAGDSDSPPGGDKGDGSHGLGDVWILRLDPDGNKLWDRTFGGANVEYAHDLIGLPDGGAIVLATSLSGASGNKISPSRGGGATADAYVIRLDAEGNRVWEQTYGGVSVDLLVRGKLAQDGLLLAGYSSSAPSGNKTSPHLGWDDLWLVRIDLDGGLLWETTLGSGGSEQAQAITWLANGDTVIAGRLVPINGQSPPVPLYGSDDFYLARLSGDQPRLSVTRGPTFRLTLEGTTNVWHRTDISTDLRSWTPWRTNRLATPRLELTDDEPSPRRHYRTLIVPQP